MSKSIRKPVKIASMTAPSRVSIPTPSAPVILGSAALHIADRAKRRDLPGGERSMRRAVEAFNALYGHLLTERDGWMFMGLVKASRSSTGALNLDDYEDGAAYFALAGECAAKAVRT